MPACPYCSRELQKVPTRKSRCPHCGKTIFVKRGPDEIVKRLVTEDEAQRIEQAWTLRRVRSEFADWLRSVGLGERAIELDAFDTALDVRNAGIVLLYLAAATAGKRHERKFAHCMLARLEAESGRASEAVLHLQQARLLELQEIADSILGIDLVDIHAGSADPACVATARRSVPLGEALREMPIPNPACPRGRGALERGFCECTFGVAWEWISRRR
jgi:DNA-directed RNA polymerase subunit RPC12/RpoP